MFLEFTESDASSINYTTSFEDILYKDLDFSTQTFGSIKQIESIEEALQLSQQACNISHQIQNQICPYQIKEGFQDRANIIVGSCGEIENQFRDIQKELCQHCGNFKQMDSIIKNKAKYAKDKIIIILEQLQSFQTFKNLEAVKKSCSDIQKQSDLFMDCIFSIR